MIRTMTIDIDTGEIDYLGHITLEDAYTRLTTTLTAMLLYIADTFGPRTANQLGGDTCASIGKALDEYENQHG